MQQKRQLKLLQVFHSLIDNESAERIHLPLCFATINFSRAKIFEIIFLCSLTYRINYPNMTDSEAIRLRTQRPVTSSVTSIDREPKEAEKFERWKFSNRIQGGEGSMWSLINLLLNFLSCVMVVAVVTWKNVSDSFSDLCRTLVKFTLNSMKNSHVSHTKCRSQLWTTLTSTSSLCDWLKTFANLYSWERERLNTQTKNWVRLSDFNTVVCYFCLKPPGLDFSFIKRAAESRHKLSHPLL